MQEAGPHPPTVPPRTRKLGALILSVALSAIGFLTLSPLPESQALPPYCIICGSLGGVDFVLNIALFVPVGVGAVLMGLRPRHALVLGVFLTLLVEGLQWRIVPGRDASLGDLLANASGALLGARLTLLSRNWFHVSGLRALPLLRAFGALASAVVIGVSFLLVPAPPRSLQWALWTATRPHLDSFPANLLRGAVNGRPLTGGLMLLPGALVQGPERVTTIEAVAAGSGGITRRKAHILAAASPHEEGFFLGQWRDAVIVRTFTNGSRIRLRPLLARLGGAIGTVSATGDSVMSISARSDRRGILIGRVRGGERLEARLRRTVGLGWTLLLPWDVAIDESWWLANALFLGALVTPVAYVSGRSRHRGAPDAATTFQAWWPLAMVFVAIALVPTFTGISPSGPGEWAGVVVATAIGITAAARVR